MMATLENPKAKRAQRCEYRQHPAFVRCAPESGISTLSLSGRQRSRGLLRQNARDNSTRFTRDEGAAVETPTELFEINE